MMHNQASLQETKQHGAVRFPFNLYPCTIPGDFPQVALHWQESMELVFVKRGAGLVQVGAVSYLARMGDIFIFTPGTLHALRQAEGADVRRKIQRVAAKAFAVAHPVTAVDQLFHPKNPRIADPNASASPLAAYIIRSARRISSGSMGRSGSPMVGFG